MLSFQDFPLNHESSKIVGGWKRLLVQEVSKNESFSGMMFELQDCPIPPAQGGDL